MVVRLVPPLSTEPESLRPLVAALSPSAAGTGPALSRASHVMRYLVPERFRGGCSFGGWVATSSLPYDWKT